MDPAQRPDPGIAYFSMEIGLESDIPTYSGGLGVLAGDTLRAAADLAAPVVAVSLIHRKGYFRQSLDEEGRQTDSPSGWSPEERLEELPERVRVALEGRDVQVRGWRYTVTGADGDPVPVYLLDTNLPDNRPEDRRITDRLYGGDRRDRLRQEAVLGLAGPAVLRAMGHRKIHTFHMNEGHAAFLPLALMEERLGRAPGAADDEAVDAVKRLCVFTTHTPVPAGHDRFPAELVRQVLGKERAEAALRWGAEDSDELNMSRLALAFARYVNGVALRHGQVSREMFPGHEIDAITNGVHVATWAGDAMGDLFDRHLPGWRREPERLRHAVALPLDELEDAHRQEKEELLREVERRGGPALDPDVFTVGFARRATAYKRADLLFADAERLRAVAAERGAFQVLYAGKAHPRDEAGQGMIRRVFEGARELEGMVRVVYVPGYDMALGRRMTAGVDLWLNNPERPKEASGTSGMKAALNGVPSLSVLDGWWIEGHVEGVTGWSIGERWDVPSDSAKDAAALYRKLETRILPTYYKKKRDTYARVRRFAIALNGAHFSARRMVLQYLSTAYRAPQNSGE